MSVLPSETLSLLTPGTQWGEQIQAKKRNITRTLPLSYRPLPSHHHCQEVTTVLISNTACSLCPFLNFTYTCGRSLVLASLAQHYISDIHLGGCTWRAVIHFHCSMESYFVNLPQFVSTFHN